MSHDVSVDPRRVGALVRAAWRRERDCHGDSENPAAGQHAWEGGLAVWHALSGLALAGMLVSLWLAPELSTGDKITVSALYAAMAGGYAAGGARMLRSGAPRATAGYLTGMFLLFAPAVLVFVPTAFLLMVLCPRLFMVLDIRWATLGVVAFNAVPVGYGMAQASWQPRAVMIQLGWGILILGFSVTLALWIRGIIRQSAERAELIGQLEATRAELATANHEAGVLAERERLAAEIHDTLAQGFTSVLMLLQAADSEVEPAPAESRRHLEMAQRTARENLAEARTLVAALAPAQLEDASLAEALRRLAGDVGTALGIPADFDLAGDPRPLPAGLEVVLLRATQEALANVRKHAGASRLGVRLHYGSQTSLEVTDDGDGFDPEGMNGFGLRGMRSRVEQVGGSLEIISAPRAGTTTRVTVP